ncbi:hypothetical protein BO79DRAFT_250092 [Aspergillus costaricaensis CBS 115574]|uniref:Uncharacterized protein n=1 Tax=Aspergillus costaricaensis CBS 115574 TaxID=1448317 RepID=A0ACD1ISA2_9EURO|nr:hypothetical protein BO79DRAFT_250092 [Aspergillus costaricaensis CBS 115574]RAK93461.1 hypothetical protein BO79DRAFT_250092 [Aspergillus costaricaensis CBS 115574]
MVHFTNKIVIGVDVGITFTGVVVAHMIPNEEPEFQVIEDWPGRKALKVPTNISYPGREPRWGWCAYTYPPTYAWFKLLLDPKGRPTGPLNESFASFTYQSLLQEAPGKTAVDMVGDFLGRIRQFIQDHLTSLCLLTDETLVQFRFSTPVAWEEEAHMAMRMAISQAGFDTIGLENVFLSSESDASARYVLEQKSDMVQVGEIFCICDIGGCTIDSVCYRVVSKNPAWVLEPLSKSSGHIGGAIQVDIFFLATMRARFPEVFAKVFDDDGGMAGQFMAKFTELKETFDGTGGIRRLVLNMDVVSLPDDAHHHYDAQTKEVLLSVGDMETFFEPTIKSSIQIMGDQLNEVDMMCRKYGGHQVSHLFITGGFAASPYAKSVFKVFCEQRKVQLTVPDNPAIATAYGSALLGVFDVSYTMVNCARTYRIHHDDFMPFLKKAGRERPIKERLDLMHSEEKAPITWIFKKNNQYQAVEQYTWGFELLHQHNMPLIKPIAIYSVDDPSPRSKPELLNPVHSKLLDYLQLDLSQVDLTRHPHINDNEGHAFFQILVNVQATLCLKKGELSFQCLVGGINCGNCKVYTVWA